MIYVEKRPHFINAFEFESYQSIPDNLKHHFVRSENDYFIINNSYKAKTGCYIIYEGNEIVSVMSYENFNSLYKPLEVYELNPDYFEEEENEERSEERENAEENKRED